MGFSSVGLDGAMNAGILAIQILGAGDEAIAKKVGEFKIGLEAKIVKANEELKSLKFKFKTN